MIEFDSGDQAGFNAGYLKTLPAERLSEVLLEEALATAIAAPYEEQERINKVIEAVTWEPEPEEQAEIESTLEVQSLFGGERDSEAVEMWRDLHRHAVSDSLEKIGRNKRDLDAGLLTGHDDHGEPWATEGTFHRLIEICAAQEDSGLSLEGDYVRETALAALSDSPGYRGVVLLRNAVDGDEASYALGVEALKEGIKAGNLNWGEASGGMQVVLTHMWEGDDPARYDELRALSIDLLARMRGWSSITDGTYMFHYAESAAQLAVTLRGRG